MEEEVALIFGKVLGKQIRKQVRAVKNLLGKGNGKQAQLC